MKPYLYKYFHELTNDRTENGLVHIPQDTNLWPESWKTTDCKSYPRAATLTLPSPAQSSPFLSVLQARNSDIAKIVSGQPTSQDLATILAAAYGQLQPQGVRRSVPSAGEMFPLELYVVSWCNLPGVAAGSYHYNVPGHYLETLLSTEVTASHIKNFSPLPWVADAHGLIVLSAVFDRTTRKYGSRGYRYILLEAGHVGQNICLAAAESGLSVRPLAAMNEGVLEHHLGLDSETEQIVYAIAF